MNLIRLGAEWCQPCRALNKSLEVMRIKLPYQDIDTDAGKALAAKYNVRSVPALIDEDTGTVYTGGNAIVKYLQTNNVASNPHYFS